MNLLFFLVKHQEESVPAGQEVHVFVSGLVLGEVIEDMTDSRKCVHNFGNRKSLGPIEAVIINTLDDALLRKLGKVLLCDRRGEEWVETVYTVVRVMTREVTEKQLGQGRAEGTIVGITSTILEAPYSEVGS